MIKFRMHLKKTFPILYFSLILIAYLLDACSGTVVASQVGTPVASGPSATISVVAAENFYGDITRQLGAGHLNVVSILSDPNIDPHEYESSIPNAVAVTQAQLVVENGSGYDAWMDKLLSASPNSKRIVLVAANLAPHKLSDNPHFWYSLENIQTIAQSITAALEKLDSLHSMDYQAALAKFRSSLAPIQQKLQSLRSKYDGTPVGLTETIFLYQTELIGLNVLTPFDFQKAIAEGNDPPADQVLIANDQITSHAIKVLVFNIQTLTPLTSNLEDEARQNNIQIVPVSETMPEGKTYQTWMLDQLIQLEQALGG